jgi:serine/threonine protein kinase
VGTALIVKLADFGLARGTGSDLYYRKMGGAVPIRWMSPEAIFDGKYSVRSDVWSFGVLIWEVFMLGQMPFYGKSNEEVLEELKHGRHLELPDDCPRTVCDMMEFCWEQDAHKRITAGELVQLLNKLMSHSKTSSNVPLFSVAEFTSIIPSDRRQQENEYIPESLVSESYKSSQLPQCGSLFINRNVDEFSCMHENGDNINQSDLMQTIQDKKEEAFTTDEDLASRRPDDYKEANIGYLPRPYTNVDPFIRDEKDTGLTSAPEKFFTDLTMFDSEL